MNYKALHMLEIQLQNKYSTAALIPNSPYFITSSHIFTCAHYSVTAILATEIDKRELDTNFYNNYWKTHKPNNITILIIITT